MFRLDGVAMTRGVGHALRGVNAVIPTGGITVIVGPSGAGKSTLLRLLNRLEEPTSGVVLFHDLPLPSYDVLSLRRRVGLLLQTPTPFPATVLENLRTGQPGLTESAATALLDRVGLPADVLGRDATSLSGGEAQRVCLARALAVGPEVLLLDEATSSLDPFAVHVVEQVVRRLVGDGLTVVAVSHDLRQAERLADTVLVVVGGRVAASGPAADVFTDPGDPAAAAFLAGTA